MCGIMGIVALNRDVKQDLINGIKRLEYRGYDSAGIAVLDNGAIQTAKCLGKVAMLDALAAQQHLHGNIGIAHTRWATHGKPSKENAHPHIANETLAVVHNGIIENFQELKAGLASCGYTYLSDTDTEILAYVLFQEMQRHVDLVQACIASQKKLKGSYALAIINKNDPETLYAMRNGSPLVIGLGDGENYVSSDIGALLSHTNKFIFLEDGDVAHITRKSVIVYDKSGRIVTREVHKQSLQQQDSLDKGQHKHYMLQEIYAQSTAVAATINKHNDEFFGYGAQSVNYFRKIENIHFVACGTSLHAAQVACYWLEEFCGIPANAYVASEFRYTNKAVPKNTLFVALSQSGETADTLSAFRNLGENYIARLAICNVAQSSLMREAEITYHTSAGREVGVAATKTFSTQLVALLQFAQAVATAKLGAEVSVISAELATLPEKINEALKCENTIRLIAKEFVESEHAIFLGRHQLSPIASEGALKLKEISYINAHAYPAGELKHGPLACIDNNMQVIILGFNDHLADKLRANISEIKARGGKIYLFGAAQLSWPAGCEHVVKMPEVGKFAAPLIYNIPLQLLSYHVALLKGTDVDQPRNLAKSVTVE
jgi:glucosamine--fructose-6-phosphate aminotransferase (isomerizing)